MNPRTKFIVAAAVFGIIGVFYTFAEYRFVKYTLHLGFGLRHNDHVMLGSVALIVAAVSLYAFFAGKGAGKAQQKQ